MNKFDFINCSLFNKVREFLNFFTSPILVSYKAVLLGLECIIVTTISVIIVIGCRIRVRFLCLQSILDDFMC